MKLLALLSMLVIAVTCQQNNSSQAFLNGVIHLDSSNTQTVVFDSGVPSFTMQYYSVDSNNNLSLHMFFEIDQVNISAWTNGTNGIWMAIAFQGTNYGSMNAIECNLTYTNATNKDNFTCIDG